MLKQYRSTFAKTQMVIALITAATYLGLGQVASRSVIFFLAMQVGAVLGAMWGVRLKHKVDSRIS